ncbi:hypothetical protein [Pseudoxanthomonas daejeonensis]|uniref:Uncharacterized protein n=1 Tax=Pseudoxanthomonas daejeonensis TaxID=266062 RepID=A0ABQ6Z3L5_9GAMM|nr:hypothetical protein [Pseudoxanthomonas daejeonensis]KAF1692201.1 hypothetical protein CSC65_14650 [Pseudoxanthomonas daejeonensis]
MGTGFTRRHRLDTASGWAFVLLAWTAVVIGFASQVTARFTGQADYPAPVALEVHVWAFSAWLVLLALQVALASSGRLHWHRRVGTLGMLLVPVMAWSAVAAEFYSQRFYAPGDPENIRFLPIAMNSVLGFVGCAVAAFLMRRSPPYHKRLVCLATTVILVAAFARWWGGAIASALPPGFMAEWLSNYAGVLVLFAAAMGYDLATRGSVHPVHRVAIPVLVGMQLLAVAIGQGQAWPELGRRLLGIG